MGSRPDIPGPPAARKIVRPPRATELARRFAGASLAEGAFAVDLTAGNGYDTAFLAERVGTTGRVLALDLQPEAVEATTRRLRGAGLDERVEVRVADHARLAEILDEAGWRGRPIAAAMANLGYLPGGPREVITAPATTLAAIESVLARLAPGGVLTVVAYPGHPGGAGECHSVLERMESLDHAAFRCARFHVLNAARPAPELVAAWRNA